MSQFQLTFFFVISPTVVLLLCRKFQPLNKLGAVIICYGIGIALGNSDLLVDGSFSLQEKIAEISVALAMPLLLFSLDIKKWVTHAGPALISMGLATFSVVVVTTLAFFSIQGRVPNDWHLVGMAVGVYTGGTPNVAAIKSALQVDTTTFLVFHTYDTLISALYIVFFLTVAQKVFNRFLPKYNWAKKADGADGIAPVHSEEIDSYAGMLEKKTMFGLAKAMLLSLAIGVLAVGIGEMVPEAVAASVIVISLTSLGIGFSFVPAVRDIKKTFQLGMYYILIFCIVVGSMANVRKLMAPNYPVLFFIVTVIFGSVLLHALLCRLAKIDTDTFLITSTAAICSPPFVPAVAGALKNKEVLLSGITTGIIGYAVGNYLGISLAHAVNRLF